MSANPSSVDCQYVEGCYLPLFAVDPQEVEIVGESGSLEPYRGEPIRADSENIQYVGGYRGRFPCPLSSRSQDALPDCRCCLFQTRA